MCHHWPTPNLKPCARFTWLLIFYPCVRDAARLVTVQIRSIALGNAALKPSFPCVPNAPFAISKPHQDGSFAVAHVRKWHNRQQRGFCANAAGVEKISSSALMTFRKTGMVQYARKASVIDPATTCRGLKRGNGERQNVRIATSRLSWRVAQMQNIAPGIAIFSRSAASR